jgi:hypothetical protein
VNTFQNQKWKQEYAIEINNRFEILANRDDEDDTDRTVGGKRDSIKRIIKGNKWQLIEKDGSMETCRNKWYNEECKIAVQEMKKAREMWLMKGRRENEDQEYHHKRKAAHKVQ